MTQASPDDFSDIFGDKARRAFDHWFDELDEQVESLVHAWTVFEVTPETGRPYVKRTFKLLVRNFHPITEQQQGDLFLKKASQEINNSYKILNRYYDGELSDTVVELAKQRFAEDLEMGKIVPLSRAPRAPALLMPPAVMMEPDISPKARRLHGAWQHFQVSPNSSEKFLRSNYAEVKKSYIQKGKRIPMQVESDFTFALLHCHKMLDAETVAQAKSLLTKKDIAIDLAVQNNPKLYAKHVKDEAKKIGAALKVVFAATETEARAIPATPQEAFDNIRLSLETVHSNDRSKPEVVDAWRDIVKNSLKLVEPYLSCSTELPADIFLAAEKVFTPFERARIRGALNAFGVKLPPLPEGVKLPEAPKAIEAQPATPLISAPIVSTHSIVPHVKQAAPQMSVQVVRQPRRSMKAIVSAFKENMVALLPKRAAPAYVSLGTRMHTEPGFFPISGLKRAGAVLAAIGTLSVMTFGNSVIDVGTHGATTPQTQASIASMTAFKMAAKPATKPATHAQPVAVPTVKANVPAASAATVAATALHASLADNVWKLNLRDTPMGKIRSVMAAGAVYEVDAARSGNWVKVKTPGGNLWANGKYLNLTQN